VAPAQNDPEWNRWRGEVSQHLRDISDSTTKLFHLIDTHVKDDAQQFQLLHNEQATTRSKIARYAGMLAAAVIILGWIVPLVVDRIIQK